MTKSKLAEIISFMGKAMTLSTCTLWYRDMVIPITMKDKDTKDSMWTYGTDLLNGMHILQNNMISLPDDCLYILDGSDPIINELKVASKEKGISRIEMNITYGCGIEIIINDVLFLPLVEIPVTNEILETLYESFQSRVDTLKENGTVNKISNKDIVAICNGHRVNLLDSNENVYSVRVSKNMFPLTGPIRKDDENPMGLSYLTCNLDSNPIVVFFANYKKCNAIHIYNFILY